GTNAANFHVFNQWRKGRLNHINVASSDAGKTTAQSPESNFVAPSPKWALPAISEGLRSRVGEATESLQVLRGLSRYRVCSAGWHAMASNWGGLGMNWFPQIDRRRIET
ncbi:MAG: hypothetical protein ACR2NZ_03680, partial [Rubripirellula sp.]